MGREYAKVLKALNTNFRALGRGEVSADAFEAICGVNVLRGGMSYVISSSEQPPENAIVAVSSEHLYVTVKELLQYGVKNILVEKPAAFHRRQLAELSELSKANSANVMVAYNRRFYASVRELKKMAEEEGITSFHFEFTELSHVIEKLDRPREVFDSWFIGNSTHVIDLAFWLGGKPKEMSCYTGGAVGWHPASAIFTGAGTTEHGCLFAYNSNWDAPGRWSVEVLTQQRRYYLKPLETLQVQDRGSMNVSPIEIDDVLDRQFKPGLYLQTKAFLSAEWRQLLSIEEHSRNADVYEAMEKGYSYHAG